MFILSLIDMTCLRNIEVMNFICFFCKLLFYSPEEMSRRSWLMFALLIGSLSSNALTSLGDLRI